LRRMERVFDIVEIGWKAYNVWKKTKLLYKLAEVGIKWTVFYEITNMVQNKIEGRNLLEWAWDLKEIWKSILMYAAFEGLAKLIEKVPWLKVKEWESLFKKSFKITSQTVLEGIALGGIWGGIDVVLGKWNWNTEMFIEWIIMAAMLRLAWVGGRFLLKIRWNKVEVGLLNKKVNEEKEFLKELASKRKELKEKRIEWLKEQLEKVNNQLKDLDNFEQLYELKKKWQLTDEEKNMEFLAKRLGIKLDYNDNKYVEDQIRQLKSKLQKTKSQIEEILDNNRKLIEKIEKLEGRYKELKRLKELQEKYNNKGRLREWELWELIKLRHQLWLDKYQWKEYYKKLNEELKNIEKKIDIYNLNF
jgi:hypothetical protein